MGGKPYWGGTERLPLSDRDYVRGSHPAACTCVDCSRRRMVRSQRRRLDREAVQGRVAPVRAEVGAERVLA